MLLDVYFIFRVVMRDFDCFEMIMSMCNCCLTIKEIFFKVSYLISCNNTFPFKENILKLFTLENNN